MDLSPLTRLYELSGPFVSVYLETESAVPDAAERLELRWKDVTRELGEQGVDEATVEALTAARGPHDVGGTRVLIAAAGRVAYARSLPEATDVSVATVRPLPYLLPLLDWAQTRLPHLVVLTDREGADILAYSDDPAGGSEPRETDSIASGQWPVHKTGTGGWSARRYESKVEENWKASARDVAAEVGKVAQDVAPRIVVLAGDVTAVQLLRDELPESLTDRVRVIQGGRSLDGSDELVAQRVLEELAEAAREDSERLLGEFAAYRGRAERVAESPSPQGVRPEYALNAADGLAATLEALRRAQVGTLLLTDGFAEDIPLYFGPQVTELAATPDELAAMGSSAEQGAAVDVLVRAALGTGAEVRLVPGDRPESPTDGVGALLRYTSRG